MSTRFHRPMGVHRDVQELEYLSALLQTLPHEIRGNGTITSHDLTVYMKSRYGITVSLSDMEHLIVTELAGQTTSTLGTTPNRILTPPKEPKQKTLLPLVSSLSKDKGDDNTAPRAFAMDIAQLVAILCIPELLLEQQHQEQNDTNSLGEQDIEERSSSVHRAMMNFRDRILLGGTKTPSNLTVEDIRQVFYSVGVTHVCEDLLQHMMDMITSDEDAFHHHVLTSDVTLYQDWKDIPSEEIIPENAFAGQQFTAQNTEHSKYMLSTRSLSLRNGTTTTTAAQIQQLFTVPSLDSISDTYRRPLNVILIWTAGIVGYFSYMVDIEQGQLINASCEDERHETVCAIMNGLASWISGFCQLMMMGVPFILLGSLGNALNRFGLLQSITALFISTISIVFFTIVPFFKRASTLAFDTTGNKAKLGIASCADDDYDCIDHCIQTPVPHDCRAEYVAREDFFGAFYYLALVFGCILVLAQVIDFVLILVPQSWLTQMSWMEILLLPGGKRQERVAKSAASHRMKQMLRNALLISGTSAPPTVMNSDNKSSLVTSSSGNQSTEAVERFLLSRRETELFGGIVWTWKKIWDGSIFVEEGIWLSGRLLAVNFAQLLVAGMIIYFTTVLYHIQEDFFYTPEENVYQQFIEEYGSVEALQNQTDIQPDEYVGFLNCTQYLLGQALVYDSLGVPVSFELPQSVAPFLTAIFGSLSNALNTTLAECADAYPTAAILLQTAETAVMYQPSALKRTVANLSITPKIYIRAAWFGLFVGLLTSLWLAAVLIPSYISTVMKFRSGVIQSLTDREFLTYRYATDAATILFGAAFWGSLFTSAGAMLLAILIFLFIGYFPYLVGALFGFLLVLLIRVGVLFALRKYCFAALYRKRPGFANIMFLVLEVWNIALTLGFVFVRAWKLLAIAVLFIARVDTPVLATGVGRLGSIELDGVSFGFRKEVLMHESHRHVLIERFGALCLMKLRAGEAFGNRAGSAWRFLFVLITMPWLRKYHEWSAPPTITQKGGALDDEAAHVGSLTKQNSGKKIEAYKVLPNDNTVEQQSVESDGQMASPQEKAMEIDNLLQRNACLEERIRELELLLQSNGKSEF